MLVAGRVSDRIGRRNVLGIGSAWASGFFVLLSVVSDFTFLLVVMALGGLWFTLFDISPSAIGGDYERHHRREAMTLLWAGFDVAGAFGAFGSGLALALGATYKQVYLAVAVLLLCASIAAAVLPLPPQDPVPAEAARAALRRAPRRRLLNRGIVVAASFVGLVALVDSVMEGYSSRYLRDVLGSDPLLAGAGIGAALLVSGLGRLISAAALRRFRERGTLIAAGFGTTLAVAVIVVAPIPAMAALGLLLLRAFEAPIVPVGYSLASRSAPSRSGESVSVSWTAFYVVFLTGPLVVGFLGDAVGLRAALSVFIAATLGVSVLAFLSPRVLRTAGDEVDVPG